MSSERPVDHRKGALRIRIGVALVLVSWFPVAQIVIDLTGLTGTQASHVRYAIWGLQTLVGLAGVAVAGRETIDLARSVGWKRMPRVAWRLMVSPDSPIEPNAD